MSCKMKQILVAEDEDIIKILYQRALTMFGYEPHIESDGVSAFEYFTQNQVDLVITDNEMPRMKGTDLIKKIRELDLQIPVILVSGTASEEEAKQAGANASLRKPVNIMDLKAKVEEYLIPK